MEAGEGRLIAVDAWECKLNLSFSFLGNQNQAHAVNRLMIIFIDMKTGQVYDSSQWE